MNLTGSPGWSSQSGWSAGTWMSGAGVPRARPGPPRARAAYAGGGGGWVAGAWGGWGIGGRSLCEGGGGGEEGGEEEWEVVVFHGGLFHTDVDER